MSLLSFLQDVYDMELGGENNTWHLKVRAMASGINDYFSELISARGTTANLDARLSVALNDDGTLKVSAPSGGWWAPDTGTAATFVGNTSFTVAGDLTSVFVANRKVELTQTSNAYAIVVSSTHLDGTTTVVVSGGTVDSGLSLVRYGQDPENAPEQGALTMDDITDIGTVKAASLVNAHANLGGF